MVIYSWFSHWKWWFFHSYVSLPDGDPADPARLPWPPAPLLACRPPGSPGCRRGARIWQISMGGLNHQVGPAVKVQQSSLVTCTKSHETTMKPPWNPMKPPWNHHEIPTKSHEIPHIEQGFWDGRIEQSKESQRYQIHIEQPIPGKCRALASHQVWHVDINYLGKPFI